MNDTANHLYGTPDEDNRQTPAIEGFRGERAPPGDDPALRREVAAGDRRVTVQESSGTAFVEAREAPAARPADGDAT